jgi:hypothetical protein
MMETTSPTVESQTAFRSIESYPEKLMIPQAARIQNTIWPSNIYQFPAANREKRLIIIG